jgi:hypothetical protein
MSHGKITTDGIYYSAVFVKDINHLKLYPLVKKNPSQFFDKIDSAARVYDGTPIKNLRQQTKALKMLHAALGTYAYYKGTSIKCAYEEEELYLKMSIAGANEMITKMLRRGASLKEIGILTKNEIDKMEEYLCQAPNAKRMAEFSFKDYMDYLSNASGGKFSGIDFMTHWFVNVGVLLKLKVIDNDEMNGWLIMKLK